ncbi:MAG: ATP-grasp fold amidoligase family protein [Pseudomonadota bacterium]
MYQRIHQLYWLNLHDFPDLVSGQTFNEKVQWLKLFDQDPRMVNLTDKLLLKQHVNQTLGAQHVPKTLHICDRFDDIPFDSLPDQFVIKPNHDSGSVRFVHNKHNFPKLSYRWRINRAMSRTFGLKGGEWQYWPIHRKLFVEEMLPFDDGSPPSDYKFHCSNGRVLWLQYIFDRGHQTKEVITDRNGRVMGVQFDHKMTPVYEFQRPDNWDEMIVIAEKLAADFKYVRVDLYNCQGRLLVGEMTFTPLNGCYKSEGNHVLGQLLQFDRSTFLPPISDRYLPGNAVTGRPLP